MKKILALVALLLGVATAWAQVSPQFNIQVPSASNPSIPSLILVPKADGTNKAVPPSATDPLVTSSGGAPPAGSGLANQASADSVSNLTFTATNKLLSSLTVKIGATSGYVMIFDAASLPSNGAVTPKWCYPVASDGAKGSVAASWSVPLSFATGITAGFSTTGCDTLTASATAKFMGQAN